MSTQAPLILIDEPDDGYCEERGYVEAIIPVDEARTLLAPYCCDEEGKPGAMPIGEPTTVRLAPQGGHGKDERWMPVEVPADGPREPNDVREFYEFDAQDVEPAA